MKLESLNANPLKESTTVRPQASLYSPCRYGLHLLQGFPKSYDSNNLSFMGLLSVRNMLEFKLLVYTQTHTKKKKKI